MLQTSAICCIYLRVSFISDGGMTSNSLYKY